jgi:(1->4)-alpha-D-glucan 1-alpha-D-glucosylmutase
LWNLSYVDPDNRRPVDYALRTRLLQDLMEKEELGHIAVMDFLQQHRDKGVVKLFALRKLLWLRRSSPDLFLSGDYIPLQISNGKVAAPINPSGEACNPESDVPSIEASASQQANPSGQAGSPQEANVLAYARQHGNDWLLVIWAPTIAGDTTLDIPQPGRAGDTASVILPPGAPRTWTDIFTGHTVMVTGFLLLADRFAGFPIAVLRN